MSELTLHTLKPKSTRKKRMRVGRGPGSGKGKTSGRGTKGQRARSGGSRGLALKGMKRMLLRIPKSRGFTSQRARPATVTLEQLERWFRAGETVTEAIMKKRNLIPLKAGGVRIVQTGALKKALKLYGIRATDGAAKAIENAGGSLEALSSAASSKKQTARQKMSKKPIA